MITRYFIHRLHGHHALLEAALDQELRRPEPDARVLSEIKKRKLQLKDRLRALEPQSAADGLHA